jgi:hypothetical protein
MGLNPDDIIEKWVMLLVPLWGPFYALYYLIRLVWKEIIRGGD